VFTYKKLDKLVDGQCETIRTRGQFSAAPPDLFLASKDDHLRGMVVFYVECGVILAIFCFEPLHKYFIQELSL
jgi:hypothetical protein